MSSRQQASTIEYKMHHITALSRSGITKTCGQNCGLALKSWMAASIAQPLGTWPNTEEWEAFLEQPCPKVCFSWFCRWHVWHVDVAAHLHAEIWSSPGIFMTPEYPWGAYHWCVGV